MALSGTPKQILGQLTGRDTITDTALHQWQRNFNAMSAVRRASFYTELIARLSSIPQAWTPFRRYIEDFAEIRQGDGSQIYLLTDVNPTPGDLYSPEYNSNHAAKFLFGNHKPDLRQSAIAQVRNWEKALTIKDHELAAADFSGMIDIASRITDSLQDSDFLSEWRVTLSMLFDAIRSGIAHEVTTPTPTDEESSRNYSAFVGALADWMDKPSSLYNPEKMTAAFNTSDLLVIVRSTLWQTIAKSQYSAAYNPEYMRGLTDRQFVTIPDELWPADLSDVSSVVISKGTKSTVLVVDNYITAAATVNAPYSSVNQARVHGSVFGINPMAAMVVIKNGNQVSVGGALPVPTNVSLEVQLNGSAVTELIRGYTYKLVVKVTDADGFTAGRADVIVSGEDSPTKHTFVQVDDLDFYVGLDENSDELTLTASAVLKPEVDVDVTLPVVGTKVPLVPPFEPVEWDTDDDGDFEVNVTPSMIATFSGKTATPGDADDRFTRSATGTVDGDPYPATDFTAPITLTQSGDTITITAVAADGYELKGTTSRTLTF